MEKTISYKSAMQGATFFGGEPSKPSDVESKVFKAVDRFSENVNIISNEPSLAFYRIQEHVRRTLPPLVERKREMKQIQKEIEGAYFDADYANGAVLNMHQSKETMDNIDGLLKNIMYYRQQIRHEQQRKKKHQEQRSTADYETQDLFQRRSTGGSKEAGSSIPVKLSASVEDLRGSASPIAQKIGALTRTPFSSSLRHRSSSLILRAGGGGGTTTPPPVESSQRPPMLRAHSTARGGERPRSVSEMTDPAGAK